jgi:hypothetical protein
MGNITKTQNGIIISGKDYVFTGDATMINNTSAHIVTDQGIIYVDTSATVQNENSANIDTLLTNVDFEGTKHNPPELTLLASEFTQAQADAIAINSAKVGIASAGVTSGNLTISLTDGTTPINSVNVVGPTGPTGPTGPAGPSGSNSVSGGSSGPGLAKVYLFNDFINNNGNVASDTGINVASNAVSYLQSAYDIPNKTNQQGVIQFQTINATSAIHHYGGQSGTAWPIYFGAGAWSYETSIKIGNLSIATSRYRMVFGFGSTTLSFIGESNGVFFTYDEGATMNGTAASLNWQCVTSKSNVRTVTTTAIPVTITSWIKLRIEINAAGTSAAFFINGTLVATHTTNIPDLTTNPGMFQKTGIQKINNTLTAYFYIDYILYECPLTTPR